MDDSLRLRNISPLKGVFVPFVNAVSYLSVSILPVSFSLARKGRNTEENVNAELRTFQCKSILPRASWAAYFPAAFESSPLVSNVSSLASPRLASSSPFFFPWQITDGSCTAREEEEKRAWKPYDPLSTILDLAGISGSMFPFACCTWQANYDKSSTTCVNPTIK